MEHQGSVRLEADGTSALHFSRADHESVVGGKATADDLLVQKTRELRAQNPTMDFRAAFERVAELNPTMHRLYLNRGGI